MSSMPRRVLVALKRVVDYNVRVRVKPDGSGVATEGAKMSINPFDEIALEEALRIKEQGHADEVVACSIGTADWQPQLRTALAMGADRALLVDALAEDLEPLDVARVLLAVVEREAPLIVLLGKQAIDGDDNQTGQMLAALWNRPQATFASSVQLSGSGAVVSREVDAGLETHEIDLPAVITTDLRLNQPRYVKLPDILKAKQKRLDVVPLAELGISPSRQFRAVSYEEPPPRRRGVRVANAAELAADLLDRGVLR
jgi:electron transfer flavoprotein beta subunit